MKTITTTSLVIGALMCVLSMPASGQVPSREQIEAAYKIRQIAHAISVLDPKSYVVNSLADGASKLIRELYAPPLDGCSKVSDSSTSGTFETGLTEEQKRKAITMAKLDAAAYLDRAGDIPPGYSVVVGEELRNLIRDNYGDLNLDDGIHFTTDDQGFIEFEGGFAARIYKNEEDGNLVLAFRGSEKDSPNDILTDWKETDMGQLMGDDTRQYRAAEKLLRNLLVNTAGAKDKNGGKLHIDVTGHSLGGGLANWAMAANAIRDRVNGWTLDAAGLSAEQLSRTSTEFIKNAAKYTINIRNEYDVVSMPGNHVGTIYTIQDGVAQGDVVQAHDISIAIRNMENPNGDGTHAKPLSEELQNILQKYSDDLQTYWEDTADERREAAERALSLTSAGRGLLAVIRLMDAFETLHPESDDEDEAVDYREALAPKRLEGWEWIGTRSKRERLYNDIWDMAEGYSAPPAPLEGCECEGERQELWEKAYKDFKSKQQAAYWSLNVIRAEGGLMTTHMADDLMGYIPYFGTTYGLVRLAEELPGMAEELANDREVQNQVDGWRKLGVDLSKFSDSTGGFLQELHNVEEILGTQLNHCNRKLSDIATEQGALEGWAADLAATRQAVTAQRMAMSTGMPTGGQYEQTAKQLEKLEKKLAALEKQASKFAKRQSQLQQQGTKIAQRLGNKHPNFAASKAFKRLGTALTFGFLAYDLSRTDEDSIRGRFVQQRALERDYDEGDGQELLNAFNELSHAYNSGCPCPEPEDPNQEEPVDEWDNPPDDNRVTPPRSTSEHALLDYGFRLLAAYPLPLPKVENRCAENMAKWEADRAARNEFFDFLNEYQKNIADSHWSNRGIVYATYMREVGLQAFKQSIKAAKVVKKLEAVPKVLVQLGHIFATSVYDSMRTVPEFQAMSESMASMELEITALRGALTTCNLEQIAVSMASLLQYADQFRRGCKQLELHGFTKDAAAALEGLGGLLSVLDYISDLYDAYAIGEELAEYNDAYYTARQWRREHSGELLPRINAYLAAARHFGEYGPCEKENSDQDPTTDDNKDKKDPAETQDRPDSNNQNPAEYGPYEEGDEGEFAREHPFLNALFEILAEIINAVFNNDFPPIEFMEDTDSYSPHDPSHTTYEQTEEQPHDKGDNPNEVNQHEEKREEEYDPNTDSEEVKHGEDAGPQDTTRQEESPIEQALALMIDAGLGEGETVLEMEQVLHDLIEGNYEGEGEPSVEEILKMAEEGGLFGDWTGGEEGTDGGCFDGPEGPSIGGCFGGDSQGGGGDVWGTIKTTTVQKLESWATKQLDSWIAKNPELQKWFGILGIDGKWMVGGVKEIWGILTGNGSLSEKIGNLAEWAQNKLCDMAVSALNYGLDKLQQWLSGIAQKWIGKAVNWLKNLLGEHGIKIPDKLLGKFQAALEKLVGKGIGKVVDIGRDAGERIINRMRPSQGGGSNGTQILQMGGGGGGTGNRKP